MYKNLECCRDEQYLIENLDLESLGLIEDILEAYKSNKIDFIESRYESGEPNFDGEFELVINDSSYIEKGIEILVLKWYEDYEDTEYLVECLQF